MSDDGWDSLTGWLVIFGAILVMCYILGCTDWERQQSVWTDLVETTREYED